VPPLDDDVFGPSGSAGCRRSGRQQAYRALALRNHPDRNPDDPGARARFDRVNRAYAEWTAARKPPGTDAAPGFENPEQIFEKFGDLFGEFFGTAKPTGARRGADRSMTLRITHGEARAGCVRHVAITRATCCTRCSGSGAERGITHACAECRGTGHQLATHGYFHVQSTCRGCNGRGRYAEVPCDSCENGLCEVTETIAVTVPPGVEAARLRCVGKGDDPGGAAGDLYVELAIDTIGVCATATMSCSRCSSARGTMFGGTLRSRRLTAR
jgi:molecular chaperone DnaJ